MNQEDAISRIRIINTDMVLFGYKISFHIKL